MDEEIKLSFEESNDLTILEILDRWQKLVEIQKSRENLIKAMENYDALLNMGNILFKKDEDPLFKDLTDEEYIEVRKKIEKAIDALFDEDQYR